jgi:oligoendopeptidase F
MATTMGGVPTREQIAVEDTWDLTTMYESDEAWTRAAAEIPALISTAASYDGRLAEGPGVVAQALQAIHTLEERLTMLVVYASLRRDEDTTETEATARYEQAIALAIRAGEELAFLQPELLSLPSKQFQQLADADELKTYAHMLDNLDRQRAHVRSQEVEEVLAQMGDITRTASEAFNALDNADLEFGEVRDEQGNTVVLTKGRYGLLQESQDRDVRRESHDRMIEAYRKHGYTIASLYGASVRKDATTARIRNYESARQEALFDDNVPVTVYDTLVEVARNASPVVERYLNLRRKALQLDQLEVYDLRVPLAPESTRHYEYRDAVDIVLRGVRALGDQYVEDLRVGFESRWVDVHETKGKRSGAYSWGAYGAPPVMLMNWNGTLSDVFTLAHEAGHAMHSFYSQQAQPFHLASYPIFLAEIASTVNEVLLTWDLLGSEEARDPVQRFALLNRFADSFHATVFRQTMFADFEQRAHELVEAGTPLTRDELDVLYGDLHHIYLPGVNVDENVRSHWSRIPHFYRAFYVYQYATGMSSAVNIATDVRDEGATAQKRYLEMLEAGGSDYPMNTLDRAGVDLTKRQPLETAIAEFERTVGEMESLEKEGVLRRAAEQAGGQTTHEA